MQDSFAVVHQGVHHFAGVDVPYPSSEKLLVTISGGGGAEAADIDLSTAD